MDHGQSGIDQTFATPAFVEDIKQCIAHKITKVILEHNDSKSDLKSQEQVSSSKRACHHCSRLLVFKEYNRSGTDKWLWCNRCAATEQRSWVRRMALKHVHFKKCQSLISDVEVARSKKLSSLQEKSSPGASSDIDECIRLDQIDLDTELSDQLSTANFKCNECRHELHLHNFLRKERLWMSCNPCNALMKRQRAATKACMRADSANLCCVPAASSASSTEVVAQTVSEPDFDPRALSKPIAVRFASCDWRSVNLLNYAPLAPSAPALHHSLINYTLSVRLLEVFGHWRPQHTPHTSSQDDFVLEVFFLLKKLKSGRIQPWPPLAAWFNLFKDEWDFTKSNVHPAHAFEQFSGSFVLQDEFAHAARTQLESFVLQDEFAHAARTQLGQAKEEIEDLLAEEGEYWGNELDKFLDRIKQEVQDDCRAFGCLNLREVFSAQDINKAYFSQFWTPDGLDFV